MAKKKKAPAFQENEFNAGKGVIGDCVRASVATLLGITRDEVPHFVGEHRRAWRPALEKWLLSKGLALISLPKSERPLCEYIACGPTTVEGLPGNHRHMVVMRGGEILHDPSPRKPGLDAIDAVYVVVPQALRSVLALPVEFKGLGRAQIAGGGEVIHVNLDRDTEDFSHLIDQVVNIDGDKYHCSGVGRASHDPPWLKGEPIAIVIRRPRQAP